MDTREAAQRWADVWERGWPEHDTDAIAALYAESVSWQQHPFREPEPVGVSGGKVADVQGGPGERRDLHCLPLRKEPIGYSTLIEHLDGACMQTARARPGEVLAGAPLDNGNVDPRQRQLARQHQPSRTSAGDCHRMLGHSRTSDRPRYPAARQRARPGRIAGATRR